VGVPLLRRKNRNTDHIDLSTNTQLPETRAANNTTNPEGNKMSNQITITGNVGQQPELRYTNNGLATIEVSVGVTRKTQNDKKTTWFDVVAFDKLAENFAASFQKGNRVIIVGRMEKKEWETKDGKKGSKFQLIADDGGLSVRWDVALLDRSEQVVAQIGKAFPQAKLTDEEPF
jgi:single-strand DNA-binding protein